MISSKEKKKTITSKKNLQKNKIRFMTWHNDWEQIRRQGFEN